MIYFVIVFAIVPLLVLLRLHFVDLKKMELLVKLVTPSNPRFGVNHSLAFALEQLRAFYKADSCFLLLRDCERNTFSMRQAKRGEELDESAAPVTPKLAEVLMSFPAHSLVFYHAPRPHRGRGFFKCTDTQSGESCFLDATSSRQVAVFIGNHFVSAPLLRDGNVFGRIFLTSRRRPFSRADGKFLLQVARQLLPIIENMAIVERLAADAAEEERLRIARDIHDSIIQPYVGSQMAIDVIKEKVGRGDTELSGDISHLDRMCHAGCVTKERTNCALM